MLAPNNLSDAETVVDAFWCLNLPLCTFCLSSKVCASKSQQKWWSDSSSSRHEKSTSSKNLWWHQFPLLYKTSLYAIKSDGLLTLIMNSFLFVLWWRKVTVSLFLLCGNVYDFPQYIMYLLCHFHYCLDLQESKQTIAQVIMAKVKVHIPRKRFIWGCWMNPSVYFYQVYTSKADSQLYKHL